MPGTRTITAHPLATGCAPAWASAWGQDEHGPFVEFTIQDATQRLRWIPPGTLANHDQATSESSPQVVEINTGFWLFDTLCPQRLWQRVMSTNPSEFRSDFRPVERASWDDCQQFMDRVSQIVPGLRLSLPTSMEWEYAYLAGTGGQVAKVDLLPFRVIIGSPPELDRVAWHQGNCAQGADPEESTTTTAAPGTASSPKARTRTVATRLPNAWGLYDMLGNVWEWCRDEVQPSPSHEPSRVLRGGSWKSGPKELLANLTRCEPPTARSHDFGFRCRVA